MLKSKLFYLFFFSVFIIFSCAKEDVNTVNTSNEISQQIIDDKPSAEINEDKRRLGIGWRCTNRGPFYNMDLYNAGVQTSGVCRYLHVYDLDQEDPNTGEILHIGTWAIPANATMVDIGASGRHSCSGPGITTWCSLLEDNIVYYFEVSSDSFPLGSIDDHGVINQYFGQCEC